MEMEVWEGWIPWSTEGSPLQASLLLLVCLAVSGLVTLHTISGFIVM